MAADLAFAGWDVVELWEQGRWAWALNLIDHLPRTSAYHQAVAEDEEAAAELLSHPVGRAPGLPTTEWSPEVEALGVVADRLWAVCNAIIKSAGGKPAQIKPYPRPVTAFDKVRARQLAHEASLLEARLFPEGR